MSKTLEREESQEQLIFNVTEDILLAMEDLDISKSELASRINKSKSFISQLLNGNANMTLRTLANICFELGTNVDVRIGNGVSVRHHKLENELDVEAWEPAETVSFKKPALKLVSANTWFSDDNYETEIENLAS